jgi:hypothetical protein
VALCNGLISRSLAEGAGRIRIGTRLKPKGHTRTKAATAPTSGKKKHQATTGGLYSSSSTSSNASNIKNPLLFLTKEVIALGDW